VKEQLTGLIARMQAYKGQLAAYLNGLNTENTKATTALNNLNGVRLGLLNRQNQIQLLLNVAPNAAARRALMAQLNSVNQQLQQNQVSINVWTAYQAGIQAQRTATTAAVTRAEAVITSLEAQKANPSAHDTFAMIGAGLGTKGTVEYKGRAWFLQGDPLKMRAALGKLGFFANARGDAHAGILWAVSMRQLRQSGMGRLLEDELFCPFGASEPDFPDPIEHSIKVRWDGLVDKTGAIPDPATKLVSKTP
jgi:hypothetical protein